MDDSAEKQKKQIIDSSVEAGELAEIQLYQTLTTMIAEKKDLSPTQLKTWNQLHKKLSGNGDEEHDAVIDSFDMAAEYCGVSKRTIHVNLKKGNIKQNADGTFDKDSLDGYLQRKGGNGSAAKSDIETKKDRADLRWRIARAQREETVVKRLKGTLLSRKEVVEGWTSRVTEVASGLEIFADRLAPLLVGKSRDEIYLILKDETRRLREAYARDGIYCPEVKVEIILHDNESP